MSRTTTGKRHEILYQRAISPVGIKIQAVCICEKLNAPARFDQRRAEEDGYDHMQRYASPGRPQI